MPEFKSVLYTRRAGISILRRFAAVAIVLLASAITSDALISLDTNVLNRSVVFFFGADAAGNVLTTKQEATGFLVMVPDRNGRQQYPLLVTARHVVDPIWVGCSSSNPDRLYIRVNKMQFDPKTDIAGVDYIAVDLIKDGVPTWSKSPDNNVDVAVLKAPSDLLSGRDDVRFLNVRNFGRPEEIAKLGVGSQVASTGLVPQLVGEKRNYPMFKFGKVAAIPDEMSPPIRCQPNTAPTRLRVWWIATNLIGGNSGSPIFFDPLFPPGGDISSGEPRAMIVGLQSLSIPGADLAGMDAGQLHLGRYLSFGSGDCRPWPWASAKIVERGLAGSAKARVRFGYQSS